MNTKQTTNTGRMIRFCVAGALAFGLAGGAIANSLIVRANGPSANQFTVGSTLAADETFTLQRNDEIVVLHEGNVRKFTGPGEFNLQRAPEANSDKVQIAMLITKNQTRMRARGGFTRSAAPDQVMQPPNLWMLDYRMSGNFCVAQSDWLFLWRPESEGTTTVTLQADGKAAKSKSLTFTSGSSFQRWPVSELAVTYGQPYRVSAKGARKSGTIVLQPLGDVPDTVEATAKVLLDKGCTMQLNRLVNSLTEEVTAL